MKPLTDTDFILANHYCRAVLFEAVNNLKDLIYHGDVSIQEMNFLCDLEEEIKFHYDYLD